MLQQFRIWVKIQLELLKKAECPSHLECGAQDHWSEVNEEQILEFKAAIAYLDDELGTDMVKFELARLVLTRLREEYIDVVRQEIVDSVYDEEFCFYEKYEHYKNTGQDVIS